MAATHKVIILGKSTSGSWDTVSCLFWFDITSGAKTQVNGSQWTLATAADNTAIQNGSVLEEPNTFTFPAGLAASNPASVDPTGVWG